MTKCKKSYYNCCRNRDAGKQQQLEGKAKGLSEEQLQKLQDKVQKYGDDVKGAKEKYEEALRGLTGYVPKYQDDMKYQYKKCQEFEENRKDFFKNLLLSYQNAVTREVYATRLVLEIYCPWS